jgi:hypothetical protein
MAISLYSFSPNTQAKSSEVNSNFTALKTAAEDGSYRAFVWNMQDSVYVATATSTRYIVPQNVTCIRLWHKVTAGSCTIRIQKNGTDLISGVSVTSTTSSTTAFTVSTITAGDLLTMDVTYISGTSTASLYVTLETQITTIA